MATPQVRAVATVSCYGDALRAHGDDRQFAETRRVAALPAAAVAQQDRARVGRLLRHATRRAPEHHPTPAADVVHAHAVDDRVSECVDQKQVVEVLVSGVERVQDLLHGHRVDLKTFLFKRVFSL